MLKRTETRVGSTADSLVRNYMLDVIGFRNANIIEIDPQHNLDDFKSKRLSAVFLELQFAKILINQSCKGYIRTAPTYRFGGFSFVSSEYIAYNTSFYYSTLGKRENKNLTNILSSSSHNPNQLLTPKSEHLRIF
ncbi:hypothetical protein DVH24_017295 [Malus domestica]|uniref:Uncharacterized protein n=1 Tax=Malus domestica TaxID=3750 RepID=A0A498IX12_MALDO|nr:hypothetical protein DVH24_017295 [Malus domestica]